MNRLYDKPIVIEVMNPATEEWTPLLRLHARVNTASGDTRLRAGAVADAVVQTFDVRYQPGLEAVKTAPQLYRLIYRGHTYRVRCADDFAERHETVRLTGEAYDG